MRKSPLIVAALVVVLTSAFAAAHNTTFPLGEQFVLTRDHVGQIDQHRPFTHPDCQRILASLNPQVVIHELAATNASALSQALKTQYHALHPVSKTEGDIL